jgi:hypothetical protein
MSDVKKPVSAVKEVEYDDLDELLGTKASTVIAPDEESKKSVLASTQVDTSFLDNPNNDLDNDDDDEPAPVKATAKDALADILDDPIDDEDDEPVPGNAPINKAGRKPALVEVINKLKDKGLIDLFEDAPNLEEYTLEDIEELLEQNIIHKVNETAKQAPVEVFKRLDPKLQDVISYALSGGTDITAVLKNVTRAQEITELSVDKEDDQEQIVREWLRETNFGTDDEIDDEISSYMDRNELAKKAKQFKPKLDSKQAEIMQKKLLEQEEKRKKADEAKKNYANRIFQELNQPELNGLKLNNRIQTALYYGITDTTKYQDRNGNATNELGHLLEKYQFGESANPSLILEALWLLKDPEGYRKSVSYTGEKKATADTVRKLKTAEAERQTASSTQGESRGIPATRPVQKPSQGRRNIFSRD